jgi:UDP-glucose 4,6-dehydratase
MTAVNPSTRQSAATQATTTTTTTVNESSIAFNTENNAPLDLSQLPLLDQEDIGERAHPRGQPTDYKTILITGGAGFIGSFMVRKMVALYPEYRIVVVDKLDYCGSLNNLAAIKHAPNFKFVHGDITSSDFVRFLLEHLNVDAILHFAAQTHVDNSFGDSFEFTKNNVMGTHVLLEAAKLFKIKRFIHVSTDEVYGEVPHDSVSNVFIGEADG